MNKSLQKCHPLIDSIDLFFVESYLVELQLNELYFLHLFLIRPTLSLVCFNGCLDVGNHVLESCRIILPDLDAALLNEDVYQLNVGLI